MSLLPMGANTALTSNSFSLDLSLPQGTTIDVTAMTLYADGKVRGDGDMCFFNQKTIWNGAVRLEASTQNRQRFDFDLAKLPSGIEKIVLTASIETPGKTFAQAGGVTIGGPGLSMLVDGTGRQEAALILCEIYKRNDAWKFRNVSQGFNGGLAALAAHFGVEVAADTPPAAQPAPPVPPAPPARPAATGSVNLTKISLTKNDKTVSLKKNDGRFGKIRVNLNWNQGRRSSGMFGLKSGAIDLDLGAFVEDRHGNITAVQALGNGFGDYDYFPYVKLLGDDRTGAVTDGEWLEINGDMWPEFHRILIYAFIYEGAPNWRDTDGVVRVMVPGQPEIEVRMNEFGSDLGTCAVAYLENRNGEIKVSREVTFHRGQRVMDDAYGWGLTWTRGRK